MSETIDRDYLRAELRALDADALYERSKLLIRMGDQYGMSAIDWAWRDLLREEWRRRGNEPRYEQAFRDVQRQKNEEHETNLRACEEIVDKRFKQGETT
jgi:hypothetical protein